MSYPEKLPKDVREALANFADFKLVGPRPYFFAGGRVQRFSSIVGTIPLKGNTRNIPVTIWLRNNHPATCPIVFVMPASTNEKIARTPIVDEDGRVQFDYLLRWDSNSEITVLVDALRAKFSEHCPIDFKGATQPQHPPLRSVSSQPNDPCVEKVSQLEFQSLRGDVIKGVLYSGSDQFQKKPLDLATHLQESLQGTVDSASYVSSPSGVIPERQSDPVSQIDQRGSIPIPQAPRNRTPAKASSLRAVAPSNESDLDLHEFEWEFDEDARSCEICQEAMIEPHLLQCCGNGYLCRKCIATLRERNMPCPLCQQDDFGTQLDRNYLSVIQNSQVPCPNKESGCEWKGIFRDAENHLKECGFRVVGCPNKCVGIEIQKRYVKDHLKECPLQCVLCPYAEAGCSEPLMRKNVEFHMSHNLHKHMLQVARKNYVISKKCDKVEKSANEMFKRFQKRKNDEISDLKLKISQSKEELGKIEEKIRTTHKILNGLQEKQEQSNAGLVNELNTRGQKIQAISGHQEDILKQLHVLPVPALSYFEVPTTFTLNNFPTRKTYNEEWLSPPFYSHQGGYKLRLKIYPNGYASAQSKFVSIFLMLTRGEFDDQLQWPMPEFHLQVVLKNQRSALANIVEKSKSGNLSHKFTWDDSTSIKH